MQLLAEKCRSEIDSAAIHLRQRFVNQVNVVPARAGARVDVTRGRQPQVIRLALLDQLIHTVPQTIRTGESFSSEEQQKLIVRSVLSPQSSVLKITSTPRCPWL